MFDFEKLIGLEKEKAEDILHELGYKDIEIVINSKRNELCDSLLVCKADENEGKVTLICGEFYLKLKG